MEKIYKSKTVIVFPRAGRALCCPTHKEPWLQLLVHSWLWANSTSVHLLLAIGQGRDVLVVLPFLGKRG